MFAIKSLFTNGGGVTYAASPSPGDDLPQVDLSGTPLTHPPRQFRSPSTLNLIVPVSAVTPHAAGASLHGTASPVPDTVYLRVITSMHRFVGAQ
jgi:hypothetical protein